MVTVLHETLHAMIHYLNSRHKLTTDPVPKKIKIAPPADSPPGTKPTFASNRGLKRIAEDTYSRCTPDDPHTRVRPIKIHAGMDAYPPAGNCTEALKDDFESVCRASAMYREEATVRAMAESIASTCGTSIPMFFDTGDFRAR